jgi:DUF1009 family protein
VRAVRTASTNNREAVVLIGKVIQREPSEQFQQVVLSQPTMELDNIVQANKTKGDTQLVNVYRYSRG